MKGFSLVFNITNEELTFKECLEGGLHDPILYLLMARSRIIVDTWIDEQGRWKYQEISFPEEPKTEIEKWFIDHVQRVGKWLSNAKGAREKLLRVRLPLVNSCAENFVKASLHKKPNEPLTKVDVGRSLLLGLLAPLRQTVGSCFASSVLIQVQTEDFDQHLTDLIELVTTGRLQRIVDGDEIVLPMNPKTGQQTFHLPMTKTVYKDPALKGAVEIFNVDLPTIDTQLSVGAYLEKVTEDTSLFKEYVNAYTQHPLNKCWEYTVSALSDFQSELTYHIMHWSLGLSAEDPGGLGQLLFHFADQQLQNQNEVLKEFTQEMERTEHEIQTLHTLFRGADSMARKRTLKREIQAKSHHLRTLEDTYEESYEKAEELSQLFVFFQEKLRHYATMYFQELYDPDHVIPSLTIYQDSPAGFCLMYKATHIDPSLWTEVNTGDKYRDALLEFFGAIEPLVIADYKGSGGAGVIQHAWQEIYAYIHRDEFIPMACDRVQRAQHKQGIVGTVLPWARQSGGSVKNVVKSYFIQSNLSDWQTIKVSNAQDLLEHVLEFMKDLPYPYLQMIEQNTHKGFLFVSPSHAFQFKPGLTPFCEGWKHDMVNTYTFVRDKWLNEDLERYRTHTFSVKEQTLLGFPFHLERSVDAFCEHAQEQVAHFAADKKLQWYQKLSALLIEKKTLRIYYFADTNWSTYYFGFVVSPFTKMWELWRATGTEGCPMFQWQSEFVKPWQIALPTLRDLPEIWKKV